MIMVLSIPPFFEPHHEKTCVLHMQKQKRRSAVQCNCAADQCLCFHYIDRTIILLSKLDISSL